MSKRHQYRRRTRFRINIPPEGWVIFEGYCKDCECSLEFHRFIAPKGFDLKSQVVKDMWEALNGYVVRAENENENSCDEVMILNLLLQ